MAITYVVAKSMLGGATCFLSVVITHELYCGGKSISCIE